MTTSDVLTSLGIGTTVCGVFWGAYERRQSQSAKQEAKRLRELLIKQQIAQQFHGVPERALKLFRHVRAKEWENGAETALLLSADLASLKGARVDLIGNENKVQVGTALAELADLHRYLPRTHDPHSEEMDNKLVNSCNVILVNVTAIQRSLHIKAALGGEDDGL